MRFKNFELKIGKSQEKPDRDAAEADDAPITQMAGLQEQLNNRTKNLEETEQQLRELSDAMKAPEEDENATPKPHGPLSELTIEAEDERTAEDAEIDILLGEDEKEVKVLEVEASAAAPAEVEKEPQKEEDDSLNSLFSQDEEEENPLASLINSLPDVTARELLDDLQEIKEIIQEGH